MGSKTYQRFQKGLQAGRESSTGKDEESFVTRTLEYLYPILPRKLTLVYPEGGGRGKGVGLWTRRIVWSVALNHRRGQSVGFYESLSARNFLRLRNEA